MARKNQKWRKRKFAQLIARDGPQCSVCGEPDSVIWRDGGKYSSDLSMPGSTLHTRVNRCSSLDVEHLVPLWKGGADDLSNLQLLCIACHKLKTSAERRCTGVEP